MTFDLFSLDGHRSGRVLAALFVSFWLAFSGIFVPWLVASFKAM